MFKIGDKIVYPMHGAGIIDSVQTKEFLGEEKEYFILKMPIGNMDISIPKANINKMNIRDVISKKEGEEILAILEEDPKDLNSNWNLRYRENQEILKTGDIFKIANMVRDLVALDDDKG
ncbi:MAG: CarD family transcriptional regulator, partial [Anaerococcus sp.]|nr:CarD family transcriptional regulator [Anaerococcus sp.]